MSAEIVGKIEELGKALHDERQAHEEFKSKVDKNLISKEEYKERIEKYDAMTDKIEEQKASIEKLEATVQRLGQGAEEHAEVEGKKIDMKAFSQAVKAVCKKGAPTLQAGMLMLDEAERKAMSNAIAEDGGFRVMPEMDSELTRRLYDTSNLRGVARVVSVGSNRYQKVGKDAEPAVFHSGEFSQKAVGDNAKTFMIELPVHEIYSWQGVTEQHMEDAEYDVIAETTLDAGDAIRRGQNTAFITGNGVDRARGITTYTQKTTNPEVYARGQVGTVEAASATAVTFDELIEVQDALNTGYLANASWLMSRQSRSQVRKLKYTTGTNEYIWELSTQAGTPANMLGNPVQIMEDMPGMTTGNVSFVFGDIRQAYTIVDRVGLSLLDDPYTGGNVRYLKYRARYGGGLINYDALKYLKQA